MFEYYTIGDAEQIRFYQLPKELVKNKQFRGLSDSAKILYALLRDRVSMSTKNGWVDDLGRVYIIFTLTEIMEDLGCANQKATKSMQELQKIGLVESVRRGLGKPNILYVKNFATGIENTLEVPSIPQIHENHDSGFIKIRNQDSLKSGIKNNENHEQSIRTLKDTYLSNTESESTSDGNSKKIGGVIHRQEKEDDYDTEIMFTNKNKEKEPPVSAAYHSTDTESPLPKSTTMYDYNTYKKIIQVNIDYNYYVTHRLTEIDMIDELIECMLDVICTDEPTIKIGRENKNRDMVRAVYLKIGSNDIDHILDRYKEQRHKITHLHSYLKTMLYTVKQESGHYYTNAVRADGIVW